jgi:hypothetical protein
MSPKAAHLIRIVRHRQLGGRRGSVIILVLATVLFTSFLLTAFIQRSSMELLADMRARSRADLRLEAYSALETALAIIAAEEPDAAAFYRPDWDWPVLLADAGFQPGRGRSVMIELTDESARISLSGADEGLLETGMRNAGLSDEEAEWMSRTLVDWKNKAEVNPDPDAPDYELNVLPYKTGRRSLRSWSELAAVELDHAVFFGETGEPKPAYYAIQRDFSLHAFSRTNLNTASASTLTNFGISEAQYHALRDYLGDNRRPGDEKRVLRSKEEGMAIIGGVAGASALGTRMELMCFNITATQGSLEFRLKVVARPGKRAAPPAAAGARTSSRSERKLVDYPFTILEIEEDIASPAAVSSNL